MAATADLRIETPRVFRPLLEPGWRWRGAWGGRAGGKSWFFGDLLLERFLLEPSARAVCIREVQKSLAESVKQLIEDRIGALGLNDMVIAGARPFFNVLNTHIETPHGGRILFQGMNNQTAHSIKSFEGIDIAWIEEAQTLSQRSLDILEPTIRKDGSEIWASWNPRFPNDPIDAFLRGQTPKDAIVVRALYSDNPWANAVVASMAERDKERDPDKYAHVWLGEYEKHSEARVFRNVVTREFETPHSAEFYLGADWGYSIDPTVMVRCYIQGRTLFVDREVYKVGCEIDHIPALFDSLDPAKPGMARQWPVTADSARPETISYLQRHGYHRMRAAKKGPGSIEEGVEFLRSYDIVVHPRCVNTVRELSRYSYKRDKLTNEVIPVLEDDENHVIDALRYAVENVRRPTQAVTAILPKRSTEWQSRYFR